MPVPGLALLIGIKPLRHDQVQLVLRPRHRHVQEPPHVGQAQCHVADSVEARNVERLRLEVLREVLFGDISGDFRCSNDLTIGTQNRPCGGGGSQMIHPLTSLDSLNYKQLLVDSIRGKTKSASHHNGGRCQRKPARLTVVTLAKRFESVGAQTDGHSQARRKPQQGRVIPSRSAIRPP